MSEFIVTDSSGSHQVPIIDQMMVGRSPNNQVVLRSRLASRRHAWVWQRDDQVVIEDLGSTHGTYVNGSPLTTPRVLRHGDVVTLGDARLTYLQRGAGRITASDHWLCTFCGAENDPRDNSCASCGRLMVSPPADVLGPQPGVRGPITPVEPVVARPFPATTMRPQKTSRRETWIVILLLAIMAVSLVTTAGVLLAYTIG